MTEDNGGNLFVPITARWLAPETDDDDERNALFTRG